MFARYCHFIKSTRFVFNLLFVRSDWATRHLYTIFLVSCRYHEHFWNGSSPPSREPFRLENFSLRFTEWRAPKCKQCLFSEHKALTVESTVKLYHQWVMCGLKQLWAPFRVNSTGYPGAKRKLRRIQKRSRDGKSLAESLFDRRESFDSFNVACYLDQERGNWQTNDQANAKQKHRWAKRRISVDCRKQKQKRSVDQVI